MADTKIIEIFNEIGALSEGHFQLSSGLHSGQYFQCAKVLESPKYSELVCKKIAEKFQDKGIQTVIGPAYGGIIVAYEVARHLDAKAIFAERVDGTLTLRRGFSLAEGEKVLLVEDVVTTGLSVKETIALVKETGAELVGVGAIVDRSSSQIDFGVEFSAVAKLSIETFSPDECPLCEKNLPLYKPGSRKQSKAA